MKRTTKLLVMFAAAAGTTGLAGAGWAYWATSGTGSGAATVGTIAAPANVDASATTGSSTVSITWEAPESPSGDTADLSYYVERKAPADLTWDPACDTNSIPALGESCTEDVADGTYVYRVTANFASWTAVSTPSDEVTVLAAVTATHLQVAGYPSPTTAGVAHDFTVTAQGAGGSTATGYTGTVTFNTGQADPTAALPPNYTFVAGDNGTRTFSATLKTATINQSIIATDTVTNTITGSQTPITVTAGAASALSATAGTPQSATVATAFSTALAAQATDSFGNSVSGVSVTFTAPASGASGTFANTTTTTTATTNAAGVATATVFTANTTSGGPYNVTASAAGATSANFALTNTAGPATKFAFTSTAVSGPASASATLGPITVQAQDAFNNPVNVASNTTVNLASNSAGTKIFAATSGGTGVTSVTILSGTSSRDFFYGDNKAGSPVITASGTLTSATQTQTITPAAASKFVFTSTAVSGPASASATLGPITVQAQDAFNNPVNAGVGGIPVALGSNSTGTARFATTSGGSSVTLVTIPSGSSSVNFFYGDTKAGSPVITASGTLTSATQTQTITASKFVITSTAVTGSASASANLGPITVQQQDTLNNAVNAGAGGTTVNLASNTTGTGIFSLTSGGATVTSVTIPSGSSSVNFYYGDTKAASPVITASGALTSATQTQTITGAAPATLQLASCTNTVGTSIPCAGSFDLGNSPGKISARLDALDQFGNAATITGTISPTVTSANGNYLVTGSPLTIDGSATPANRSNSSFTVTHQNNANNSATITVHAGGSIPDFTFQVQK